MKITAYEEYGLRIILRLAKLSKENDSMENKSLVSLNDIASSEGISVENTAAILSKLRDAQLIESVRGKYGGYKLKKEPSEINLFQIVSGISKDTFDLNFCETHSGNKEICVHNTECSVRSVWTSVSSMINNFLASITLKQLMQNESDFNIEIQNSIDLKAVLQNG
jgi:Rrf2 family transcriptional regulator, iron-sulfur cluster assembly transcription factor